MAKFTGTIRHFWVSCTRFTGFVSHADDGVIVRASPAFSAFIGQPVENLLIWWCRKSWGPIWTCDLEEHPERVNTCAQLPPHRWRLRHH